MFFAQYIQILYKHISHGLIQPAFTEEFMCHTTDRIKQGDRGESSYKNYFSGVTIGKDNDKRIVGDAIGSFASKRLIFKDEEEYEACRSKLQKYLAKLIEDADAASQLANAFRKEIPDISSVDISEMAKKLSELGYKTLNQAINAKSPNKGNSIQEPNNELGSIPSGIRVSINEKINEILLLIDIMLELGKEITDWQKHHTMSTPISQCSSWQKLHEKYDRYHDLTIELSILNRKYHIELLEPAITISKRFSADSFWRCNPIRYFRTWDTLKQIEELSTILSNISNELEKGLMM